MPMIRVNLSVSLADDAQKKLLAQLSSSVAGALGKPESYMMVLLEPQTPMLMGGDEAATAFVDVRSVGSIVPDQAKKISAAVSGALADIAGVDPSRVYANFTGVPGPMWGIGDRTFG